MPTLKISLKHNDDAHVEDTWRIYYAFIGRLYQRAIDSQAGFSMMEAYTQYEPWTINVLQEELEYIQDIVLKCNTFTSIFNVELIP